MRKNLHAKIKESLAAVLPVTLIVLILSVSLVPMTGEMVFMFLLGTALLIAGIGLFTLGADTSMILMGEKIGAGITKSRKLLLIIVSCLIIGIFITIAEPDLRVLAEQAPIVENTVLIISVAVGVGVFLLIAFLRIFFQIKLSRLLIIFYIIVFALALSPLIPSAFIPVAFDSGGVTTGPITVPFILSLGIGLAKIRGDKSSEEDTFGLVALCSIGPILTVLILGAVSGNHSVSAGLASISDYPDVRMVFREFLGAFPHYLKEVVFALLPIVAVCAAFRLIIFKLTKQQTLEVIIGFAFTFIGLVLFLTGVNIGFMPVGIHLGRALAESNLRWLLVPLGALIGYFIVSAEPAVHVLKQQVQDVTQGKISGKSLGLALSIGVAASVGIAMLRILAGIDLIWFIVPGYLFSLIMTFFVPGVFTAIAFDSGGVASGPMTATFLLPFAMGACAGVGGDMARDAFGIVAMVAMTPLITIQLLGLTARLSRKKQTVIGLEALDELLDVSGVF
ncbi:MAG: DUF1538 domain-containing protein [Oscillospiraceae bacterium]|nr:DUF1538 domain-containing protein [Oscillospiraceae bacterium]